jgi:hypothetical protein
MSVSFILLMLLKQRKMCSEALAPDSADTARVVASDNRANHRRQLSVAHAHGCLNSYEPIGRPRLCIAAGFAVTW